jgi:hypothetical protein
MSRFLNTTNRTVVWFKKANDNEELQMKPPFQRNPVWTHPQKSYLIDSILNGYPIPEIYMQEFVDESGNERHILIDGQQRIRTCLEFVEGTFAIAAEESPSWGNMRFDDLSPDDKKKVFGYTFIVRLLPDMSDDDIRGIFQRLNKNVVALNAQELRQATYWGPFLQTMQEISNYKYWTTTGIFTPLNVRRMMDIEFISELAIAILEGHQNKKETIDLYYATYEEYFDNRDELVDAFQSVIMILEILLPDIKNTRWRKKSDFYSLFVCLAEFSDYAPLDRETKVLLRQNLDGFAASVTAILSSGADSSIHTEAEIEYAKSIRASSDLGNRKRRHAALSSVIATALSNNLVPPSLTPIAPVVDDLFASFGGNDDEDSGDSVRP